MVAAGETDLLAERKIFELRYVGARFEGPRLPTTVLADLSAFRDLLVAYAKDRWRQSHADRERLPKGFDKSISFDLIGIDDGSAVPRLDWSREQAQAALPGFTDELEEIVEQSFEDLVGLIDDAGQDHFPAVLSSEHIRALNRFGAGLRDQERIEFTHTPVANGNVVYLDSHRRKTLITHVRETYQLRFEGIGDLRGFNVAGYIDVRTEEYGELRIKVDGERIGTEFDGNIGAAIQFELLIELDNRDAFCGVVEVFDVELIDPDLADNVMRCMERLTDLGNLRDGWHDGEGLAPSEDAIEAAKNLLRQRPSLGGCLSVFPTPTGGVIFEFEVGGWDYSVEIEADGGLEFLGIQIDGPDEFEAARFPSAEVFLAEFEERVKV